MTEIPKDKLPIPNGWNTDDLADFIHRSMYNVFATFDSKKSEYKLLKDIDAIYQKAIDNFSNTPSFLPAMFFCELTQPIGVPAGFQ